MPLHFGQDFESQAVGADRRSTHLVEDIEQVRRIIAHPTGQVNIQSGSGVLRRPQPEEQRALENEPVMVAALSQAEEEPLHDVLAQQLLERGMGAVSEIAETLVH